MAVFTHPELDAHELVAFHADKASGLRALIAVHNSRLGNSLGGCRMYPYRSEDEALADVLRLSRAMTYKAALAGLPQGGGKSVIFGDPRKDKTPEKIRAMGRFIDSLSGKYVVAEDSGTNVADMRLMAEVTRHVGGLADASAQAAGRSGDPSPATALGVFIGLKAAVRAGLGREDLRGVKVAVQGLGNVGMRLAQLLHEAGARLCVTDLYPPAVERAVKEFGATAVGMGEIAGLEVDVFAPCALGAILNDATLPALKAKVIAGAANNQLAQPRHGQALFERGIFYAPDYIINAGGIIDIHYEGPNYDPAVAQAHIERIGATVDAVFERSRREHKPTHEIADRMAEEIFGAAHP